MYALYDDQRKNLGTLAVMLVCGGLAILPLTMPPSSIEASAQSAPRYSPLSVPQVPGTLQFPVIAVQKDPFVADVTNVSLTATSGPDGGTVRQGQDIGIVLPANAGADGAPPQNTQGAAGIPTVRGVVLGDEPQALIDTMSGVKVFSIGDSLAGEKIRSIDATGVTLTDGAILRIASPSP